MEMVEIPVALDDLDLVVGEEEAVVAVYEVVEKYSFTFSLHGKRIIFIDSNGLWWSYHSCSWL